MTDAITRIAREWEDRRGRDVVLSLAASSTLARQIERGAPADVFISASNEWMDWAAQRGIVEEDTRVAIVTNRLVLIAPRGAPVRADIGEGLDLEALLAGGRLSTGDPQHVPVGRYARSALEHLGQWEGIEDRIAPAPTTRAALAMVERGETPLGIVYATDALASDAVTVVDVFPEDTHTPIVFSAAAVAGRGNDPAVRTFIEDLIGDSARLIFAEYGYGVD